MKYRKLPIAIYFNKLHYAPSVNQQYIHLSNTYSARSIGYYGYVIVLWHMTSGRDVTPDDTSRHISRILYRLQLYRPWPRPEMLILSVSLYIF